MALKVKKSQKQILKFSFAPKNERKYFSTSALAYKKRSNQNSSVRESKKNPPVSGIKCSYFFLFEFLRLGQKSQKKFCWYFGLNDDNKRTF